MSKLIVVLGQGLLINEEGDCLGNNGGRFRTVAAAYLQKGKPESFILASGRTEKRKETEGRLHASQYIKNELIKLGIPKEKIIEDNKPLTTFQQLIELKKFLKKRKFQKVIIISNNWHIPRIQALIDCVPELKFFRNNNNIELQSAELILLKHDCKKWKKSIDALNDEPKMKKIIASEKQGVKDLKLGKYKFK